MENNAGKININTADLDTLSALPGIGSVIGRRILDHREEQGPFRHLDELSAVSGISPAMVEALAGRIVIGPALEEDLGEPRGSELPDSLEQPPAEPEEAPGELTEEPPDAQPEVELDLSGEEQLAAVRSELSLAELSASLDNSGAESPPVEPLEEAPSRQPVESASAVELPAEDHPILISEEIEQAPETRHPEVIVAPGEEPFPSEPLEEVGVFGDEPVEASVEIPVEAPSKPAVAPSPVARRGTSRALAFIFALLGAVLGIMFALALLCGLNGGSLRFASQSRADDLQSDLSRFSQEAQQTRSQLDLRLQQLDGRLDDINDELTGLLGRQGELEGSLSDAGDDIAGLDRELGELEVRVQDVILAAEDFNTFITGLRELLQSMDSQPGVGQPQETPGQQASPEALSSETPSVSPTAPTGTPQATRTPRPTVTPFITPTSQQG